MRLLLAAAVLLALAGGVATAAKVDPVAVLMQQSIKKALQENMKQQAPGLTNIYMELGSTFGQLVTTNPTACAHLLGQIIGAFGADHVLWGTDSIWYGTPQWQIDAFRRV